MLLKIAVLTPHVSPPSLAASRRNPAPWTPSAPAGPYKLPRDVQDRLRASLKDFRNRDEAAALAVFLGRFWSSPARLVLAFPIDRRALADHPALGLTEARVRGAIATLVTIGFIAPDSVKGSGYRATAGGLHRKPILFRFGVGYREDFARANTAAQAMRSRTSTSRRPVAISPIVPRPGMPPRQVAQRQNPTTKEVLMGEHERLPEEASPLELVLARLRRAVFDEDDAARRG